jgi:hypothetical protein
MMKNSYNAPARKVATGAERGNKLLIMLIELVGFLFVRRVEDA